MLKASRKKRIAAGSGTRVEDVNKLLKMHRGMADMMKAMGGAKRGPMAGLANMLGMGGGAPSPEKLAELAEVDAGRNADGNAGIDSGMPAKFPGGPSLPGLGAKPPGFGLPGLGRKK